MVLDRLADGDAAGDHGPIIGQIEHKQVPFVTQHSGNLHRALLSDLAVGEMQVCQRLVVLDA